MCGLDRRGLSCLLSGQAHDGHALGLVEQVLARGPPPEASTSSLRRWVVPTPSSPVVNALEPAAERPTGARVSREVPTGSSAFRAARPGPRYSAMCFGPSSSPARSRRWTRSKVAGIFCNHRCHRQRRPRDPAAGDRLRASGSSSDAQLVRTQPNRSFRASR